MPRPNRPRDVHGEEYLAQRITMERTQRRWSYEGLAERMTSAGCAINGSAIFKIEHGQPRRRRITVDELVAFSRVFEIPVERLLLDPKLDGPAQVRILIDALRDLWLRYRSAAQHWEREIAVVRGELEALIGSAPEAMAALDEYVEEWASQGAQPYAPGRPEGWTADRLKGLVLPRPEPGNDAITEGGDD